MNSRPSTQDRLPARGPHPQWNATRGREKGPPLAALMWREAQGICGTRKRATLQGDIQLISTRVPTFANETTDARRHMATQHETQTRTTAKCHLTPGRVVIIERTGENATLGHCLWECELLQTLWKTMDVRPKINLRTATGSSNPFPE